MSPPRLIEDLLLAMSGNHPLYYLSDLLFVEHNNKSLLVAVSCSDIKAFEVKSGILVWEIDVQCLGIERPITASAAIADDQGHLFISDFFNVCIHIMLIDDGSRVGGLKRCSVFPAQMTWCKRRSSLIVSDPKNISIYKIVKVVRSVLYIIYRIRIIMMLLSDNCVFKQKILKCYRSFFKKSFVLISQNIPDPQSSHNGGSEERISGVRHRPMILMEILAKYSL